MPLLAGSILTAADLLAGFPKGQLANNVASGASAAMSAVGAVVTLPSTSATITNNDSVTRNYIAYASVRVNMASGANGIYRPLVTNGATSALGGGTEQFHSPIAGSTGQTGASTFYAFTLAASASLTLGSGGLRVSGGGATDTFVGGRLTVLDLGAA